MVSVYNAYYYNNPVTKCAMINIGYNSAKVVNLSGASVGIFTDIRVVTVHANNGWYVYTVDVHYNAGGNPNPVYGWVTSLCGDGGVSMGGFAWVASPSGTVVEWVGL